MELVAGLRDQGLEIVGYTWWPLFDFWATSNGFTRTS